MCNYYMQGVAPDTVGLSDGCGGHQIRHGLYRRLPVSVISCMLPSRGGGGETVGISSTYDV